MPETKITSIIFEGDLWLAFLDGDGNNLGRQLWGNNTKLALLNETEKKAVISRGRDTSGQKLGGVTRLQGATVGIYGNTFNEKILAAINRKKTFAISSVSIISPLLS